MKKPVLLIVSLFVVAMCHAQKAYKLAFAPPNGDKYDITSTVNSQISENIMGQEIDIQLNYMVSMLYEIIASGPNKKLSMTYQKVKMDLDAMGHEMSLNSENDALKSLEGQVVSAVVTPDGKVLEIEGADGIIDKVSIDEKQKKTLEGYLGKESLRSMLSQSFGFYPEKPVKAGDSWSSSIELQYPYAMKATSHYTLQKVEGKTAFINILGKMQTDSSSTMKMNDMELKIDITGDIKGICEVDIDTGMPLVTRMTQTLKGNIELMGQKVPLISTIESTMQAVKK